MMGSFHVFLKWPETLGEGRFSFLGMYGMLLDLLCRLMDRKSKWS